MEVKSLHSKLTAIEYAARIEMYLLLVENISNGWTEKLHDRYKSPYQAKEIIKEIKVITSSISSSLLGNGDIIVKTESNGWVGNKRDRIIFCNCKLIDIRSGYKKKGQWNDFRLTHIFTNTSNDRIHWDTKKGASAVIFKKGDAYDFRATVKSHELDDGGKYTRVVCPKIINSTPKASPS